MGMLIKGPCLQVRTSCFLMLSSCFCPLPKYSSTRQTKWDCRKTRIKFDLSVIDEAISRVSAARGRMGAVTNAMEHAYNSQKASIPMNHPASSCASFPTDNPEAACSSASPRPPWEYRDPLCGFRKLSGSPKSDRKMIQGEVNQLLQDVQRTAVGTKFNEMSLLDGSMADMNIAANADGTGMKIGMENVTLKSLGINGFDVTKDFDLMNPLQGIRHSPYGTVRHISCADTVADIGRPHIQTLIFL